MASQLSTRITLFISIVVMTIQLSTVYGHSWVVDPPAFNPRFPTTNCRAAECTNACPNIERPSLMRNTPDNPAAEWRRGELVRVCWARNNHHGGISRITLVPVSVMNSRPHHDLFTIFKTCWDAGQVFCRKLKIDCGTDPKHAFCRKFRVPHNFPNGDYVLGYQWYGGLHFKKKHGWFPDFRSCSFVRINGGSLRCNKRDAYTPYFEAGDGNSRKVRNGRCLTSIDRLEQCDNGCKKKKAYFAKPFPFGSTRDLKNLKSFNCDDVREAQREHSAAVNMLKGHCESRVCCDRGCRGCGGKRCNRLRGGSKKCCVATIIRSRRKCANNEPPCIRPEYRK